MSKQETVQKTASSGPGRPAKGKGRDPVEISRENLQYALDRACMFIHDGQQSFARRARRAAKVGIPQGTLERGLDAMAEALADARAAVTAAYAPVAQKPAAKSRVEI